MAAAFRAAEFVAQIQTPHHDDRRKQHQAHNADVGQQPHGHATQEESPQRVPPKGAVRQIQRNHEHTEKG